MNLIIFILSITLRLTGRDFKSDLSEAGCYANFLLG